MARIPLTAAPAVVLALLASAAARADECKSVNSPIVTSYTVTGCASPVGLCTDGTVAKGLLAGTTHFTVLTLAPGPGPGVLLYTGELVITTRRGMVTVQDSGLFNEVTGQYFELQKVVSGTRKFSHADGVLTSQGTGSATGFSGTLTGSVCLDDEESGHGDDGDGGHHEA
jgi:hypothetical protein